MSRAVARIGIRKNKDEVLSNDLHQLGIDLQSGMISSAPQFVRRLEGVRDITRKAMEATNNEPRSIATMEVTQGLIELHGYLSQQLSRLTLLNRGQVQGKMAWGGQMQWILGVFGWLPTDLDVDAKTFKSDTADLQRMAQLYPSRAHGSYSGVERSAFSPGGIFGSSSSSFSSPNRPAKVCHGCGKPGHILRYCNLQVTPGTPRKQPQSKAEVQCHRCQAFGHYARECPQGGLGGYHNHQNRPRAQYANNQQQQQQQAAAGVAAAAGDV